MQIPQDRYSLAALGRYDITNNVELKLSTIFTSNKVPLQLAPTPFFSTVTIDLDNNPFLTPEASTALRENNRGSRFYQAFIGRRMIEAGPRRTESEKQNLHLAADLRGEFSNDWSWDIHGHYSREVLDTEKSGNISISAMQAAVFSGQCNIFGADVFSDTCVNMVARTSFEETVSTQYNLNGTIGGDVDFLQSPKAENPLQILLGAEYREDKFDFRPDGVLGPDVSGFNQELPIDGTRDSYAVFGEFYWPIIENKPAIDELSVMGAVRYSRLAGQGNVLDTSPFPDEINSTKANTKNFTSYNIGAEWQPNSNIKFHANFDKSFRQPSIQELFSANNFGFFGAKTRVLEAGKIYLQLKAFEKSVLLVACLIFFIIPLISRE